MKKMNIMIIIVVNIAIVVQASFNHFLEMMRSERNRMDDSSPLCYHIELVSIVKNTLKSVVPAWRSYVKLCQLKVCLWTLVSRRI